MSFRQTGKQILGDRDRHIRINQIKGSAKPTIKDRLRFYRIALSQQVRAKRLCEAVGVGLVGGLSLAYAVVEVATMNELMNELMNEPTSAPTTKPLILMDFLNIKPLLRE